MSSSSEFTSDIFGICLCFGGSVPKLRISGAAAMCAAMCANRTTGPIHAHAQPVDGSCHLFNLNSSKLCEFCIFCVFFFKLGDSGPEFLVSLMILVNLVDYGDFDEYGDSGDFGDSGEFGGSGKYGDSGESGDSGYSGDSGKSGDSGESGESGI